MKKTTIPLLLFPKIRYILQAIKTDDTMTERNPIHIQELQPENIKNVIYEIRGQKVMLDRDLADMYEVEVSQLKRQVRRNIDRFPQDFIFELTPDEVKSLRCQNGTIKNTKAKPRRRIGYKSEE